MKRKAPLALMEMLVMILVFALAAALCLSAFILADDLSEQDEARDLAVMAAQTAAETVKYCCGDFDRAAQLLNGVWAGGKLTVCPDDTVTLFVTPAENGTSLLGTALVEVYFNKNDTRLFELTVAWQEEDYHENE